MFKAYASQTGYNPWSAFNGLETDNTVWYSETLSQYNGDYSGPTRLAPETVKGEYLVLEMPYEIVLKQIKFYQQIGGSHVWDRGVYYAKSDPLEEWTAIHNVTDRPANDTTPYVAYITDPRPYKYFAVVITRRYAANATNGVSIRELQYFGTPGPTTLDKGSLSLTRSLDVPRISRYDVDTETPRPEKLVLDFDTTVNSSPTDISGQGNHGTFNGTNMNYSAADKAFDFDGSFDYIDIPSVSGVGTGAWVHSKSFWFKMKSSDLGVLFLLGRNGNTRQLGVQYNGPAGQFQYYIYGCNARVQVNGSDWLPDLNRWYHCVTVFKNNENVGGNVVLTGREMYIDGVKQTLVSTGTQIDLDLDSSGVRFGNQYNSANVDYQLSNPKLYSVALEPSEVKKLYRLGRTGRSMVISDTAVGIGKVPEAQLDVRGNLNVDGVITNQQRPAFYVWRDGTGNSVELKNTVGVITNWDSKRIDTAGTFDLSNGRYYIPVSGLYNFVGAGLYRYNGSGNGILEVSFYVNGSNVTVRGISYNRGNTTAEHQTVTITFMRFMNAGDYVQMGIHD